MDEDKNWQNYIRHPTKNMKKINLSNSENTNDLNIFSSNSSTSPDQINRFTWSPTNSSTNIKNTLIPVYCILLSLVIVILGVYAIYKFLKQRNASKIIKKTDLTIKSYNYNDIDHRNNLLPNEPIFVMDPTTNLNYLIQQTPSEALELFARTHQIETVNSTQLAESVKHWVTNEIQHKPNYSVNSFQNELQIICSENNITWQNYDNRNALINCDMSNIV